MSHRPVERCLEIGPRAWRRFCAAAGLDVAPRAAYKRSVHCDYDVVIAGAGPAGCAVAARLVQQHPGRATRILVLDRYRFPRDKPCGGGLTGHADRAMAALGLKLEVPHVAVRQAEVRYGDLSRQVALGRPVQVVRRREFDASLLRQVRARGVAVVEGEAVQGFARDGGRVVVQTSRRQLRSRVLVGADGAASVVRKQLASGVRQRPHRLFMHELEAAVADRSGRDTGPTMIYDFSLMARGLRGYLWLFPAPAGTINVGLMHYPAQRLGGRALTGLLREGLVGHGVTLPARGARGWPVWGYDPDTPVHQRNVLTVGDAVGIDGLTGEGIAVAMEQAIVAADLVHRGLDRGELGFDDYPGLLRRAVVGRELALDRLAARLLYGSRWWRDALAIVLCDRDTTAMYAARVDGSEVLAAQKARLTRALARHLLWRGPRLVRLWRAGGRSG